MDDQEFTLDGAAVASLDEVAETAVVQPDQDKPRAEVTVAAATSAVMRQAQSRAGQRLSGAKQKTGLGPFYFDLETTPDYDRLESFGLDPVPEVPPEAAEADCPPVADVVKGTTDTIEAEIKKLGIAPAAWLDKLAVAEDGHKKRNGVYDLIKKARAVRADALAAKAERCKLLSTTPEYCSIAALGWFIGGDPNGKYRAMVRSPGGGLDAKEGIEFTSEERMLETFWQLVSQYAPACGFNIGFFDIPVILVRSAILGVEPSKIFDARPWGNDLIDIYTGRFGARGNTDAKKPGKLKLLAPLYGIDVPAEGVEGSQVDELMKTDPKKVGEYVISDVKVTVELHRKLSGYFWA